jgi:hypothetical protein
MAPPPSAELPPLPSVRPLAAGLRASSRVDVPDRLATVLRGAVDAEQLATGEERFPALRLTRYLIAGAREAGYSTAAVAQCLGISTDSVRTRGTSDGWVAADDFAALADLAGGVINQWAADGVLDSGAIDAHGHRYYPASDLILALCRLEISRPNPA